MQLSNSSTCLCRCVRSRLKLRLLRLGHCELTQTGKTMLAPLRSRSNTISQWNSVESFKGASSPHPSPPLGVEERVLGGRERRCPSAKQPVIIRNWYKIESGQPGRCGCFRAQQPDV